MKAPEAARLIWAARQLIRGVTPPGIERAEVLVDLERLENGLVQPASLCTRDELFDAVICDEPPEGEPSLLDDLLDQVGTGALVAYLSARLAEEAERARALRADTDPHGGPMTDTPIPGDGQETE